jgi:hypothetical protein
MCRQIAVNVDHINHLVVKEESSMLNKYVLGFLTVGVMAASAAAGTYKVQIFQDSVIDGKQVKAGNYKIEMENNTAVLKQGKQAVELPARAETAPNKFSTTEIRYTNSNNLQEICIGGTATRIVFSGANSGSHVGGY